MPIMITLGVEASTSFSSQQQPNQGKMQESSAENCRELFVLSSLHREHPQQKQPIILLDSTFASGPDKIQDLEG